MRLKPLLVTSIISLALTSIVGAASFHLRPLKVYADAGEFNVRVPLILDNSDEIGAWEVLVSYDTAAAAIARVDVVDSVLAVDPDGDTLAWFHSSWSGDPTSRPEYLSYVPNADGHADRVRIIAIMDMVPPPIVPPIPTGQEMVIFCLVFNVRPSWQENDILVTFETELCKDNTLTDASGYLTWGPDTASADPSTCPQRDDSMRVVHLTSGPGITSVQSVEDEEIPLIGQGPLLREVFPNPSNGLTAISYHVPLGASVRLTVWDSNGRLRRTLLEGRHSEMSGKVFWDGRDDRGTPLPSGIYYCRMSVYSDEVAGSGHFEQTRKLVLLR